MSLQLYTIWLQDAATANADDSTQANVSLAGLLGEGGLSAEKIATEAVDVGVEGQWRLGPILSEKLATQLKSLAASDYEGVELFDTEATEPLRGYYEVASVDTEKAHPTTGDVYQYVIGLNETGTKATHWKAVQTNVEDVDTNLATGSGGQFGLDDAATKVRWFDPASGFEAATVQSTAAAEFGSLDLYDPSEPSFVNPILLYEIDYGEERNTDVVVYDDKDRSRDLSLTISGTAETYNQWIHVFHPGYDFDGLPVVDTGRLRVRFDEPNNEIEAYQWNDGTSNWDSVSIDHTDYTLFDADIERISPTDVRVFTEWTDVSTGDIDSAVLSFQRGLDEVVVRIPDNESSVPSDLESLLTPIASDQTTDPTPEGALKRRNEVK